MKKPNLFILGAPKCGTTSMAYYLSQHPEVFVSPYKEPHYFNFDSGHRFTFTEKQYLAYFRNATNSQKYLVDASVFYLYSKVAATEILKYNPESKFIVMLRNPVDMFYSLHQQFLFSGIENISSPLKAWNIQNEREKGLHIPYVCKDKALLLYQHICALGEQVNHLLTKADRNKVHFILMDDLKNDPAGTYKKVLDFLEIELTVLPDFKVLNEKKEKIFPWISNVFSFVNKTKKLVGLRKGLGFANFIIKKNKKAPSEKYRDEFLSMKPMLFNAFKDDINLLEKVTGINLENWKQIEQ